jgi:hypothetical protein
VDAASDTSESGSIVFQLNSWPAPSARTTTIVSHREGIKKKLLEALETEDEPS